jgi:hypothetical protein
MSFSSVAGYNGSRFFSVVCHNAGVFLPEYPTPQQNLMRCPVSHNTEVFSALYPTPDSNIFFVINITQKDKIEQWNFSALRDATQQNIMHCIPQCRRFSFVVSHNGRDFPPLWHLTKEVFLCCGIQWRWFFSFVGYTEEVFSIFL